MPFQQRCRLVVLLCLWTTIESGCRPINRSPNGQESDLQSVSDTSTGKRCGAPLISAWDQKNATALGAKSLDEALGTISAANLKYSMQKVGALSADEAKIVAAFAAMQAPIVRRIDYAGFLNVFDRRHDGAFNSIRSQGLEKPRDGGFSNQFEDDLYNAWSCAFASVGTFTGQEHYGEVLIGHKVPLPESTWGTRRSGFGFFNQPSATPTDQAALTDMRIRYAQTLVVQKDWAKWSAYDVISMVRGGRGRIEDMLAILQNPDDNKRRLDWWNYFDKNGILFMEAKTDDKLPFNTIEFIEMTAENLANAKASGRIPDRVIDLIRVK